MRVRYVLPNKHYVPVDMKYIGVDNTTPYVVPHHFMVWSNKELGLGGSMDLKGLSLFWKCHLPRVVEQKFDGGCDGFSRSKPLSLILCHLSSVTPRGPGQLTYPPFILNFIFPLPIAHQTKRRGFHPSGRTKVSAFVDAAAKKWGIMTAHTDVICSGLISATISRR